MDPSTVTTERDGHLLRIGLNRPGHRNLFDLDMLTRLAAAYGQLDHDPDLRAGLLFGRGSDFCAGLELAAVSREAHADGLHSVPPRGLDPRQVGGVRLSKPMVAAVHGTCITLAVELVLVSNVVIAAESPRFAQLEASRGGLPFGGSKEKNNEHQSAFSRHLRHPDPPLRRRPTPRARRRPDLGPDEQHPDHRRE